MAGVVQRLAEERQVHRAAANGHVLQVAQAVFQVADAVLARQFRAELHHLFGIVDGDHLLGALRHQLGDGAFARAQVGDHHGRHELEERFGDALPGAAGHVLASEFAGQLVEVAAHLVLALAQGQAQRLRGPPAASGTSPAAWRSRFHQLGGRRQAVEGVLAGAPVVHQAGLLQLRQVGGNVALALRQDLLQLRHGQLFLLQQQQQPQPAGVGRQPQRFQD